MTQELRDLNNALRTFGYGSNSALKRLVASAETQKCKKKEGKP